MKREKFISTKLELRPGWLAFRCPQSQSNRALKFSRNLSVASAIASGFDSKNLATKEYFYDQEEEGANGFNDCEIESFRDN